MATRQRRKNGHAIATMVSVRGQTIIPKPLREACQIHEGDLLQWRLHGGGLFVQRVVVRPAEASLSDQDWRQLDRLVAKQRKEGDVTRYRSLEAAKEHTRKLIRHAR